MPGQLAALQPQSLVDHKIDALTKYGPLPIGRFLFDLQEQSMPV